LRFDSIALRFAAVCVTKVPTELAQPVRG
jgi:hypothetical protein